MAVSFGSGWLNSLTGGLMLGVTNMANADTAMKQKKQEIAMQSQLDANKQAEEYKRQSMLEQYKIEHTPYTMTDPKGAMSVYTGKQLLDIAQPPQGPPPTAQATPQGVTMPSPTPPQGLPTGTQINKLGTSKFPSAAKGTQAQAVGDKTKEDLAWKIADGTLAPNQLPRMGISAGKAYMEILDRADQIARNHETRPSADRGLDVVQQEAASKFATNRMTVYNLARIKSMNGVMDKLLKASDEAQQTKFPLINKVQQYLTTEGGSTRFTDLKTTAGILGEEVANVIAGGQATPVEILKYQTQLFNAFENPDQLKTSIESLRQSLAFRQKEMESAGTPKDYTKKVMSYDEWLKSQGGK